MTSLVAQVVKISTQMSQLKRMVSAQCIEVAFLARTYTRCRSWLSCFLNFIPFITSAFVLCIHTAVPCCVTLCDAQRIACVCTTTMWMIAEYQKSPSNTFEHTHTYTYDAWFLATNCMYRMPQPSNCTQTLAYAHVSMMNSR